MLSKEEIERLRNIVRDKNSSLEERRNAFLRLQEEEASLWESEWKDYLEYSTSLRPKNDIQQHRIYKKIRKRLTGGIYEKQDPAGTRGMSLVRAVRFITGAAALLVLAAGIYYWVQTSADSRTGNDQLAIENGAAPEKPVEAFDTIFNNNKHFLAHLLPDSSLVELAPQSFVTYKKDFSSDKRIVFLHGAGKFSIHKKEGAPFSVYVDGMEVRDLGTVFYVQSAQNKLKVHLIKGKVLVRSLKPSVTIPEIVLKPGQEVQVNTVTGTYAVQNKETAGWKGRSEAQPDLKQMLLTRELSFNSTPVDEVLKELGKEFGVTIIMKQVPGKDLLFTGQFLEYMSLAKILDVIARSYNLEVYSSGSTILFKKIN
ncbi:MAG TPA: FecR family protein [Niabella sp.]